MLINEIASYRHSELYRAVEPVRDTEYISDIYLRLRDLGYVKRDQILGQGIFGVVFKRPQDSYVIKLFKNDPAYRQYLKYVLQHQDNPHVPKIRGKLVKPYRDANLYLVRIEELEPLEIYSPQYDVFEQARDYALDRVTATTQQDFREIYPRLASVLDDVKHWGKTIDLHDENIMVRPSDNMLVITDPIT